MSAARFSPDLPAWRRDAGNVHALHAAVQGVTATEQETKQAFDNIATLLDRIDHHAHHVVSTSSAPMPSDNSDTHGAKAAFAVWKKAAHSAAESIFPELSAHAAFDTAYIFYSSRLDRTSKHQERAGAALQRTLQHIEFDTERYAVPKIIVCVSERSNVMFVPPAQGDTQAVPYIVCSTHLVDALPDAALDAVIGHELQHAQDMHEWEHTYRHTKNPPSFPLSTRYCNEYKADGRGAGAQGGRSNMWRALEVMEQRGRETQALCQAIEATFAMIYHARIASAFGLSADVPHASQLAEALQAKKSAQPLYAFTTHPPLEKRFAYLAKHAPSQQPDVDAVVKAFFAAEKAHGDKM